MDLDKIKEIWDKTEIQATIGDEDICKMLSAKRNNALDKLLLYEKIGVVVLFLLIPFPVFFNWMFPLSPFSFFNLIWYTCFCILAFFWGIYKVRCLKKIDLEKNNLLTSLKQMTRYKLYIRCDFFIGLCWFVVFIVSYVSSLVWIIPKHNFFLFIATNIAVNILLILLVTFLYKIMYTNNINKIMQSIVEIRELERDNV